MKSICRLFLLFLAFTLSVAAQQLPDFTLQVTPTPENCSGNGTATIVTGNTAPGAALVYTLYLLPNATDPIGEFPSFIQGLSTGNYRVVATQTLAGQSNSKQVDFTITDAKTPLLFSAATSTAGSCETTGTITVTVNSGSAPYQYEITQGPTVFPLQPSNVFANLAPGTYRIRVLDSCGSAEVLDYTLFFVSNVLTITNQASQIANDCSSITVTNSVTPPVNGIIVYPITATNTVHFPSGDQVIMTSFITGDPALLNITTQLPLFGSQAYTYDLSIVDGCNKSFSLLDNDVDPNPKPLLFGLPNECGEEHLIVSVENYLPPYTVNFVQAPSTFVPQQFNNGYPGPFNDIINFGDDDNPVPEGTYQITVTDNCGRTATTPPYDYVIKKPTPSLTGGMVNCITGLGNIVAQVQLPVHRDLVLAVLVDAPVGYPTPLPQDVSSFINSAGVLVMTGMGVGTYKFKLKDICGTEYVNQAVMITPFVERDFTTFTAPSCDPSFGTVRITSPNNSLTNMTITAGPGAFTDTHTLPYDVSSLIVSGVFSISQLPPGSYTFEGKDACNVSRTNTINVQGYISGTNNYTVVRNCGSFNLILSDNANVTGISYWLQLATDANGNYGNPQTGAAYPDNTVPTTVNSMQIFNGTTLYNMTIIGTYRIVKVYQSADSQNQFCLDYYDPFTFTGNLDVVATYNLDCMSGSGTDDVYVDVLGVPPYQFKIIKKDGAPFNFDNGSSNIFLNLTQGVYIITVEDSCGRIEPATVNVGTLQPLAKANDPVPSEILVCSDPGTVNATFDLTLMDSSILGNQSPLNYKVTYHHSQPDADAGINEIQFPATYQNTTLNEVIYARVVNKRATVVCYGTASFKLIIGQTPVVDLQQTPVYLCEGDKVRIFAQHGYSAYEWQDGTTLPYLDVTTTGTYTVLVKNVYGTSSCSATQEIKVDGSSEATIESIDTEDWSHDNNMITVNVSGQGAYSFSIDGNHYQSSNVFEGLQPGVYQVYVKDDHGCGIVKRDVFLLNYPKFFTPNGDGYNDMWQINFALFEPGIKVFIFDRYGKLITMLDSASSGWDGTLNGKPLPSTDYWFNVERTDGRVLRGHFAMKR